ncbi:MAG: PDZ domain-containing protein [Myxococcales bacterium]|nr:PDZ domain-containing protein [Myxococcales bacterium]
MLVIVNYEPGDQTPSTANVRPGDEDEAGADAPLRERAAHLPVATAAAVQQPAQRRERTVFELNRRDVLAAIDRPGALGSARPVYKAGKIQGIGLGVEPNSPLSAIGLLPGDVLTAVDGKHITDLSAALAFVAKLRRKRRVTVQVQRRGVARVLRYWLR